MQKTIKRLAALSLLTIAAAFPLASSAQTSLPPHSVTGKWVTGYYGGYFWDNRDYQAPQYVDMTAMTHFVFARIGPGGGQNGGAPGDVMFGSQTAHTHTNVGPGAPTRTVEQYMIDRAHAVGTKTIIMLGGEGDNGGFRASTTDAVRPLFVKNLLDYMEARNYDGIDVDWEGIPDSATQDQYQLEKLIADLRTESAKRARWQDTPIIITYPAGVLNMNTDTVKPYLVRVGAMVDQFNLMSYGMGWFASGWHSTTFAPLTGATPNRPVDIKSTIQKYVDAGIPREKIGMGLGFYGMNYKPPFTQPGQVTDGYDRETMWSVNDVTWNFTMLHKYGYLDNGTYVWDPATQTSYRTYAGGYTPAERNQPSGYLSYEDPASIAAKGAWAQSANPGEGAAGTIIWLVNYGTTNGVNNPLMHAVKKAFLDPDATEPPPPPPAEMKMELVIENDWNSGYCGKLLVSNVGGMPAFNWSVTKPFPDTVTSLWNATYTATPESLTVSGASWNKDAFPGGAPIEVGICANRAPKAPETPTDPEPGALQASYVISNDWGSGYCGSVTVSNSGSTLASSWTVEMAVEGTVASLWNGKYTQAGSTLKLSGPDWNRNLAAGAQYKDMGFCANR
ncbi:glycosyl hydrolase family 18 protein [Pseudoduganella sp. GCM10020061]|uniref:glycosyl hydrolase family 18 protein n=1 Tax=Pseudoduganella sp. GCM10020061 TaxID=3317345 RepID=UPI003624DAA1